MFPSRPVFKGGVGHKLPSKDTDENKKQNFRTPWNKDLGYC